MTPSGWHDDTRSQDAGHDEMQVAVWRYLKARKAPDIALAGHDGYFARQSVYFECEIVVRGRIVAWCDILELWSQAQSGKRAFFAYEVKPRIYSVGGLVRQCVALAFAIREAEENPVAVRVFSAVRRDDPKLSLLRAVAADAVATWDGEVLRHEP